MLNLDFPALRVLADSEDPADSEPANGAKHPAEAPAEAPATTGTTLDPISEMSVHAPFESTHRELSVSKSLILTENDRLRGGRRVKNG